MKRVVTTVLLIALFGVVAWFAICWAREPLTRRWHVLEASISLKQGEHASWSFTPQMDGMHEVSIRFQRQGTLEELEASVGPREGGPDKASGLKVSYVIREGTRVVERGQMDGLEFGEFGRRHVAGNVVMIPRLRRTLHTLDLHVERASGGLVDLDTAITVGPVGDWIAYAWLEALMLQALVGVALLVLGLFGTRALLRRRRVSPEPVESSK